MICECYASLYLAGLPPIFSSEFILLPFFSFFFSVFRLGVLSPVASSFPPLHLHLGQLILSPKKKKKINICSTYLFALDSCSFNKQADNPRKPKKKTDPCLGMQAFFCPQQPNIPFLSWGFACKSEKRFFKQSLHRLTVIRSFLPIHIWVLSFQKKRRKTKNPLV